MNRTQRTKFLQSVILSKKDTNAETYSGQFKNPTIAHKLFKMNNHRRNSSNVSTGDNNKNRKREVREIEVVRGNKSNNNSCFKGVKPVKRKPPRKTLFY